MANDQLKHENEPPGFNSPSQWINEIEIPGEDNEAAEFRSTVKNGNAAGADYLNLPRTTMPFSLFPNRDMQGTPKFYAKEMPLTGINLMTGLTPLRNSGNPKFHHDYAYGESDTPIPPSPVSNFLWLERHKTEFRQFHTLDYTVPPDNVVNATSAVNVLQKPYVNKNLVAQALNRIQQGEQIIRNAGRPQPFRNFASDGVNAPVLCDTIDGVEIATNNNFMISELQGDCLEKVDASFLTLGIGQKTEDLSKSTQSGINVNNFERVVLPQSNTFPGRKEDRSFSPSPDEAAGLPCLQNNVGGFNVMTNNMTLGEMQHHCLMPGNGNVCLGDEGNWDTGSAYFDTNNSCQGYPAVSLIPVGSSLAGLPDSGQSRATELPLPFSSSTSTSLPVYETARNLFSDSSMCFPPIGATRSTSLQDQSGNYSQPQVISAVQSSTNISRSVMTGEEVPITEHNGTAQGSTTFVATSLKRVAAEPPAATSLAQRIKRRTQPYIGPAAPNLSLNVPSLPNLSNASSFAVLTPAALSRPLQTKSITSLPPVSQTSLTLLPQANGTAPLPSQYQNAPFLTPQAKITPLFRPLSQNSLPLPTPVRRTAILHPLSQIAPALPSQAKTITSHTPLSQTAPSLRPQAKSNTSLTSLSNSAPSLLPLPHIAPPLTSRPWAGPPLPQKSQTASVLPPKSRTAPPLPPKSQTASSLLVGPKIAPPLPSQPQTGSTYHINWKGFDQTQPTGHKCLICKRDLSFAPEGPVFVPTIQPMVAVLPCGHTFHDHCLRLITPEDEVKNPPCIPCAIGES